MRVFGISAGGRRKRSGFRDSPRAAVFATSAFPSQQAHVGAVVGMTNALEARGFDTTLYALFQKDARNDLANRFGLRPEVRTGRHVRRFGKVGMALSLLIWLSIAATRRYEVTLTRSPLIALFALRSKVVLLELHQPPKNRIRSAEFDRIIIPLLPKSRVRIVVISERLRELLKDEFPTLGDTRVVVAPSGFRSDWYSAMWSPPPPGRRVAYVGSLHPGRGVDVVVEIAQRLPDAEFFVAGGTTEQWGARVGDLRVPPNCHYLGHMAAVEVPQFLHSCAVLLAPYQENVFIRNGDDIAGTASPLKLVEYMASGRPIVTSALPLAAELLVHEEDAMLVGPTDIDAWADVISTLLGDPEVSAKLAQSAHRKAHTSLNWDTRLSNILTASGSPARAALHKAPPHSSRKP